MAFSWNLPALANKIAEDIPALKGLLTALVKWTDAGTENVPTDAKRLQAVTGGKQIQSYSGSAWASVGKLMHDVDMLDGKHATSSATADTIPVRDANGKLAGDILGNAATSTTASGLASTYTVPVARGGTGATDAAGARTNLGTNNAANITTGVLAVARGGTGSSTKNFVDLSTAQTIGGDKKFSGKVILNKNVLQMIVLDTTEGATAERTDTIIQGISPNDGNGINTLFGSSGGTILGAGEGKTSLLAELAGQGAENVHLIADSNIYFHINSQTYANKKTVTLNASAELSGLAKVTATSFVGALTGNASTATSATKATQDGDGNVIKNTYLKLGGGTMTGQLVINRANGSAGGGIKLTGNGQNYAISIVDSGCTKGTAPSATRYMGIDCYGSTYSSYKNRLGMFQCTYKTDKETVVGMYAYNALAAENTGTCAIECHVNASGTGYTYAPTPSAGDSSTKIATTAFCASFIKALSVSGRTITYTKSDGSTGTITTQDNNTTYSNFVKSGSTAAAGLVPKPSTTAGTSKYLREDCSWQTPPNTTYSNFVKSGSTAAAGLVPKPSTTAGTTKYLREDCSWQVPPNTNTTYSNFVKSGSSAAAGLVPKPSTTAGTTKYLREDCSWQVPPNTNTTYSNFTASTTSAAGTAGLVPAPPKLNATTAYNYVLNHNGWKTGYANPLNDSDKRIKQDFKEIPVEVLDAWEDICWIDYKLKKDVKDFKDKARENMGLVVQDIHAVFTSHGLDNEKYNLTFHDLREFVPEEKDEEGNIVVDAQPAVDEWKLNYIQALSIEAAYQRRRASRAEARIAELEQRLAKLEASLSK